MFKREGIHLLRVARQLERLPTATNSMIALAATLRSIAAAIYDHELGGEDSWDGIEMESEDEIEDNDENEEISVIYHYIPPDM
jgi:hypothetical protein